MSCPSIQTINGNECIGDSLPKINNNFSALSGSVCSLNTETEFLSGYASNLLTLINQLSTNMQNIGNYPYLEYAWVTAPNTNGQVISPNFIGTLTLDTEVADTGNFGSISSNQITLAAGTYRFEAYVPYNMGGSADQNIIFGLFNSSDNKYITRAGVSYTDGAGTESGASNISGQFTINSSKVLYLTAIISGTDNLVIRTAPRQTSFTNSTANADQRTTIKLWKVG